MPEESVEKYFNYCPKCASTHFDFVNHRRFECHDCGMVFFQNIAAAVAVVLEKGQDILLVVRNQNPKKGWLDLPGGFTDPDETAEETCARELNEELNLQLRPQDFTYFGSHPNRYIFKGIPYRTEDLMFAAQLPEGVQIKLEEDEIQSVQWISKEQVPLDQIAFESLKNLLSKYLKSENNA